MRQIIIEGPISALTANSDVEYRAIPTISGQRVAAAEVPVEDPLSAVIYVTDVVTGAEERVGVSGSFSPSLDAGDSDQMVYVDGSGAADQVRYHNFGVGTDLAVGAAASVAAPAIGGSRIVWRLNESVLSQQIIGYDLTTGVETTLSDGSVVKRTSPAVGGDHAVWARSDELGVRLYDFATSQTQLVASDAAVSCVDVSGDWVVFVTAEGGSALAPYGRIHAHNLASGENRVLTAESAFYGCPSIDGNVVTWGSLEPMATVVYTYDLAVR